MSINPPFPAIFNLNEDILLYIFTLNANMLSHEHALDTTRITSQVCRGWRHLMLATSSLWARVIDMDYISYPWSEKWRHELIRRSGDAPLSINANSLSGSADNSEFFNFVEKNWHRIQLLLVSGHHSVNFTRLPLGIPAPQLEIFEVIFGHPKGGKDNADIRPIPSFGGHAPMLRNLQIFNYEVVDYHAPWLCHLYSLSLKGSYSGGDLLEMLSEARNIHELQIVSKVNSVTPSSFPTISLPHLESLEYEGSPLLCATLLDHVDIPQGCVLFICLDGLSEGPEAVADEEALLFIVTAFTHHTQRFLQHNSLHAVDLELYLPIGHITFDGQHTISAVDCPHSISILLIDDTALQHLAMILGKLALLDLSGTTTLQFWTERPSDVSFGPLFNCFPLLDTICLDRTSVEYLMVLQDEINATNEPSIIFPCLKVFKFSIVGGYGRFQAADQIKVAVKFLLSRLHYGYPIALLDMRKNLPLDAHPDFAALAEVNGLEVLYTCSLDENIAEHTWSTGSTKEFIDPT